MATRWLNKAKVLRRLRNLPKQAKKELHESYAAGANELVALMQRRAPKRKGKLRRSIMWRPEARNNASGLAIRVTAGGKRWGVSYAHIVERGSAPHANKGRFAGTMHPGTTAQPFFYPTYRQKKRALKSRHRRAFKKAIAASSGA